MEYIFGYHQIPLIQDDGEGLPLFDADKPDVPVADVNHWMSETAIIRVETVYGFNFWISERHYEQGNILLPICTARGVRTAKQPKHLHRDNIVAVKQRKQIT